MDSAGNLLDSDGNLLDSGGDRSDVTEHLLDFCENQLDLGRNPMDCYGNLVILKMMDSCGNMRGFGEHMLLLKIMEFGGNFNSAGPDFWFLVENVSTADSDRGHLVSPLRVHNQGDEV